ncbi:dihydroxyacetone kinase family protein [Microbacterium sp. NPDC097977]|uniref:dihydroxyacetone kinase family protein n=1 Tax=Microbacterium sp. NPDC097977 TaxID=3155686 RepID=UPI0033293A12
MSYVLNAPEHFRAEMITGFVRAHGRTVRAVPGGVVRSRPGAAGKVSLIIGGGSGHYPAFAGLVGEGLADGAAMGEVFASPSATQITDVARAAEYGGGVLLCYGNYTGDVLNFSLAEQRLRREGINCRTVRVTDDVSSADASERHRRRGVAGDLVVFKVAGAAAERGDDLAAVAAVAEHANANTFTVGVAFSGCTLPGAAEPLFSVASGRMAVGMGIHGEPGLSETALVSAGRIARMMVSALAEEGKALDGARLAVVVNGLGSVSLEELFVLFRDVAQVLDDAGAVLVAPEVGELVTSFEMAGASLTLTWLDDELEELWCASSGAPAFTRTENAWVSRPGATEAVDDAPPTATSRAPGQADRTTTVEGTVGDGMVGRLLDAARSAVDAEAEALGRLDAVAGDGDHGIGMRRGLTAAAAAARGARSTRNALHLAADAWADHAGGTSGALWGLVLGALSTHLPDGCPSTRELADGWSAAAEAVQTAGGARRGDKTMVDALQPFADELAADPDRPLSASWAAAVAAAREGASGTADLVARQGRARSHGAAGLGHPDPGAVSFVLVVAAAQPMLEASR